MSSLRLYIVCLLYSLSTTLLLLIVAFIQTTIFNLQTLSSGSVLTPLSGDCALTRGQGECHKITNISNYPRDCNGPMGCLSSIENIYQLPGVRVVGVVPLGITANDTYFEDIVKTIHTSGWHLASFIMILLVPFVQIISLFLIRIKIGHFETVGNILFISIRAFNFISIIINTYANKIDSELNGDTLPSVLSSFNNSLPSLALLVFFFNLLGDIIFINQIKSIPVDEEN